jgi:hypothetical protein
MMVSLHPLQGEHGDDAEVLVTLGESFWLEDRTIDRHRPMLSLLCRAASCCRKTGSTSAHDALFCRIVLPQNRVHFCARCSNEKGGRSRLDPE